MALWSLRRLILLFATTLLGISSATAQQGVGMTMIGIASGQSARVSALNLGSVSSTQTSSCTVTFQFLDSQGKVLKEVLATLQVGKAANLDLSRDQLPGEELRAQIRAVLLYGYTGGAPPNQTILQQFDCNIAPSLEVYDNTTGRTSLILTDSRPLPMPNMTSLAKVGGAAEAKALGFAK